MTAPSDGLLDLRFTVSSAGRTQLARRAARFPLRITAPMYLDPQKSGMAFVYVQNPTGGVFADDRLNTQLELSEGTQVHLTTQAATKVYRMNSGYGGQATTARLGRGSYLELVPDIVIPYAGSRLIQRLEVELATGARFFRSEMLAPGRLACGEAFGYTQLELETRIYSSDRVELLADTLVLEPARRSPTTRGLAGSHAFIGTALALAPGEDVAELATTLDRVCEQTGINAAACLLPGDIGVAVRALANSHRTLRTALDEVWGAAREILAGAAPPRRRK